MTINVRDMMTKKLETIEGSSSIQDAAKRMRDTNVSSLVVVDNEGKPLGIVTERDIVRKACIHDVSTSKVTNKEIMSSPIITIEYSSSTSDAADKMLQYNIRHLLVVNSAYENPDDNPIGILTPRDFTRYQEYANESEKDSIEKILEYYI